MTEQQPKSESEESNRMWASASFVGVLIIIGLPLWWKTTEVYRVALPYDKISAFNELPSVIASELTILANDQQTAAEVASFIQKAFQDEDILNITIKKSVLSDDLHRTLESVSDEQDILKRVAASVDLTSHNQFHLVQRRPLKQDVWLAGERVMFFKDAKASPTLVQALKQWVYQTKVLQGARSEVADAARRTRFPPGAAYHVVLSVIHPRPDQLEVQFNAKDAVEDYIGSFVDELSELHNFTLKSQWLYLLDFDFKAKEIKDNSEWGRHFAVRKERLHLLLTSLEERAATHVSPLPTLNLVLYAAPCKTSPLLIHDEGGNPIQSPVQAFMSPKWGGVVLASPPPAACAAAAWAPDARPLMGTFVAQLRTLLGVPDMSMSPKWVVLWGPPPAACAAAAWAPDARPLMGTFVAQLRTLLGVPDMSMSRKWGGVVLVGPPPAACAAAAWAPDARPLMGTFVAQLRTLLGVPDMSMSRKWGGVVLVGPPPAACAAAAWAPDARPLMGTFVAQLRTLLGVPDMSMSRKWGGVVLVGPPPAACAAAAWAPDARPLMGTFVAQLRTLLGVPDMLRTLLGVPDMVTVPGAFLVPLRAVSPRRWEVDALLRMRTLEQLTNAQRTLLSLAQLLGEISNIVINDEVGASINAAVDSIHRANELAAQGKLLEAYRESLRAHAAAESAFMEPSLLALLYFPDDQKYAIYIPLFLPIMFPVVLSLKNLLLWLRGKPSKIKTD
ncbi:GPI transamidase component PIG-S [Ostrinia nubilalis]|uniref:GPI transamidase component PIG-S n=1 Tax=Ostrinia nubilalis TaxID=29057 RepID=UPI0030826A77